MKLDNKFEATFVRIIGLIGFILATVAFLLTLSGMTEMDGEQSAGSVLFISFIMCMALAFVGLMISTLAQVLRSSRTVEDLLVEQNKILRDMAAPAAKTAPATKAAPAKKAAPKKVAAAKKTTTTKKKASTAKKKVAAKKK